MPGWDFLSLSIRRWLQRCWFIQVLSVDIRMSTSQIYFKIRSVLHLMQYAALWQCICFCQRRNQNQNNPKWGSAVFSQLSPIMWLFCFCFIPIRPHCQRLTPLRTLCRLYNCCKTLRAVFYVLNYYKKLMKSKTKDIFAPIIVCFQYRFSKHFSKKISLTKMFLF